MEQGENSATAAIFQVLADDHSRRILLAADREPKSAKELSEICGVSLATIYRRVSTLETHGLVEDLSSVDSDGSHRRKYETTLEELHAEVSNGELELSIETRDELADNFSSLWTNLREDL
ncbi:ArsR/SmtB family transcription factor [Halorussus halophilus]|uniref:ArsR/SmtB family transcription factor n=1 Tax=Halorussus halophilus TaxID=2650975 RepID=UPI0013018376|nr:winged helix-turn-helix domain-containing protein [Halorussus halophilus]